MLCYRCGSHNDDGSNQCSTCGQPLTRVNRTLAGTIGKATTGGPQKIKNAPFEVGEIIRDRYTVVALLGSGPSGFVYKVSDCDWRARGTQEHLALKLVHARLLQTQEDRTLFEQAIGRTKKMAHPGIARVFDVDMAQERLFFTMELVAGLPLARIIAMRKGEKAFSLAACEPIMASLTQALEYSHRVSAHGMLKPQNIIVQPGELKITDFTMMRGLPRKPYIAGLGDALSYAAPELRKDGTEVMPPADVFSLGVVLTEMLTGTRPDTVTSQHIQIADTPGMTPPIRAFLRGAMEAAPDRRWRSLGEFMQALQALVDEPMCEPVIITSPVQRHQMVPPPVAIEADPTAVDTPPGEKTQVAPKSAPAKDAGGKRKRKPVRQVRAIKPVTSAAAAAKSPAGVQDRRALLRPQEAPRRSRRGIIAAAAVLSIAMSLAGVAVWPREQHPNLVAGNEPASAPVKDLGAHGLAGGLPTPAVEKQKGSEPVKVAGLGATRVERGGSENKRARAAKALAKISDGIIEASAVALAKSACHKGMIFVAGGRLAMGSAASDELHNFSDKNLQSVEVAGFCVDRYEYPNTLGAPPTVNVSVKQAKAMCESQGKRLCAEERVGARLQRAYELALPLR